MFGYLKKWYIKFLYHPLHNTEHTKIHETQGYSINKATVSSVLSVLNNMQRETDYIMGCEIYEFY